MANVFISYRREDAAAYAGRINDQLAALFGEERVFMDVNDIAPGQNFAQAIDQTLAGCGTVLVVIGPRWMELLERHRTTGQTDYVAHEIEAALVRKATVVPVLVGGAAMTQLTQLPAGLADLAMHQAVELRDASFKEDCLRLAKSLGVAARADGGAQVNSRVGGGRGIYMGGAGLVLLAVLGWFAGGEWRSSRQRQEHVRQLASTAQVQMKQGEFEPAFRTYQSAVKEFPGDKALADGELDAAMLWLENFHVLVPEGQKAEDLAGPALDQLMALLDAGLARADPHSSRAADILAHSGWAHWLNQHIASREFGPAAENAWRQALAVEPGNVFANAMLGNWLLQNGGSLEEALRHFDAAVKTGKQRTLVREMQLGGMVHSYDEGVPSALFKVVNEMRLNGENLGQAEKRRIVSDYDALYDYAELRTTLAALPAGDAWATYLWLDDMEAKGRDGEKQRMRRAFIHANILELAGQKAEALAMYEALKPQFKPGIFFEMANQVDGSIKRLSSKAATPAGPG